MSDPSSLYSLAVDFFMESPPVFTTSSEQQSIESFSSLSVDCAWCLAEQQLPMGEGSHGICAVHAQSLYRERKES